MTMPERILWRELRGLRRLGLKFRRQAPLGSYVVDFYEPGRRLVIELDGDSHVGRAEYDRNRQAWLKSQHLEVLRISNDDVIQDVGAAIESILAYGRRVPGESS